MKRITAICISAALLSFWSCGHNHSHEHEHDHEHEQEHQHDHDHDHDHGHEAAESHEHAEGEIVLEPEMAARFGVRIDTVRNGMHSEALKAAGTFLSSNSSMAGVTAPLAGTVSYPASVTVGAKVRRGAAVAHIRPGSVEGGNTNSGAKAAMDAAKRELDRLKPLYDDRLVTVAEYNAALAAYEQAKAAYSPAASGAVHAPISGVITSVDIPSGAYADAGAVLMQISSGSDLTLRVDVPQSRYGMARRAVDANVILSDGSAMSVSAMGGRRISGAEAGASAPNGFVSVYFSVPASEAVAPGATAEVYLLGEVADKGIAIPRSALSEQQGSYFVYEKIGDHAYRRLPVTIGGSDGINTIITSGLKGGEAIVTEAVTTVRLAENSGAIPEGHNHNH